MNPKVQSPSDFQSLLSVVKDFDPHKLTADVIKSGEEWADQDAAAASLEETKKTLLAQLMLDYIQNGGSGAMGEKPKPMPASQAEMRALADERYQQHLELMVQARREANRKRVRYDLGKMKLELIRSLQATLRNEIRISSFNP